MVAVIETSAESLEGLFNSLFLADWRDRFVMPLAAYFDASGHEDDQKYVVVAGFVSDPREWVEFTKLWTERLAADGIEYFNAGEFTHSVEQFEGWRGDVTRRQALTTDLMAILKPRVFRKFGSCAIIEALNEMSEATRNEYLINAYSLGGRSCAADLRGYLAANHWETAPELIFEDGDKGKGKLREILLRDGFPEPLFKPKKDRTLKSGLIEKAVVPLQAADWLAYEMFQTAKQNRTDRWAFNEFHSTPGHLGIFTPTDIKALETELNTPLSEIMRPIPGDHFFVTESQG